MGFLLSLTHIPQKSDNKCMKKETFLKLVSPYLSQNIWLALSSDEERIVGKGKTIVEALREAKKNKEEKPTIIKASPHPANFIGTAKNGI